MKRRINVIIGIIAILAWLFFLVRVVLAEDVEVLVCTAPGVYVLSRSEAINSWKVASKQINKELKIKLRVIKLTVRGCNLPLDYKELYSGRDFNRLLRFFKNKKNVYNFAIIPGVTDGDRRGVGGVTNGECGLRQDWNLSIAAITPINLEGDTRIVPGRCAIAHEMAHNLGCWHDESSLNVMMANALPYSFNGLHFNRACRKEVRECKHASL